MSAVRAAIQRALLGIYESANRRGWLDSRAAELVFQRSYFAYKSLVEDPFAKLAKAHPELFRGGDVIDVGANIGYTATVFARAIQPPHKVHAFEPEERNFRWLGHAIERAGVADRVIAHRAAVGAKEETIELWNNTAHHADHRIATDTLRATREVSTQLVPLRTLDRYLAERGWPQISFVKIDVQGYEPEVLRGMMETIARNPNIHIAVELMPSAMDELGFDPDVFLNDLGAALPRRTILGRDGQLSSAAPEDLEAALAANELGYVDLVCSR